MEKTYKRVPFDIELAKKIQSGEVEGRIIVSEFANYVIELPEETREQHRRTELPDAFQHAHDASYLEGFEDALKLRGEVRCTENTEEKHEFKPFDKVLVRDDSDSEWICDIFSDILPEKLFRCVGGCWNYCIAYDGHEHLVGTTDNPE